MGTAKIIDKVVSGNHDHTVILNVRQKYRQQFVASDWIDLRIGFLLSLTQAAADDTITGLSETIPFVNGGPVTNYYFIGLKDDSTIFPAQSGSVFIGFTNSFDNGPFMKGDSVLVSSDLGIGTTNSDYWRPKNSENDLYTGAIYDGLQHVAGMIGANQHFVQNFSGGHAAGYATLLMLRLTRPDPSSNQITVTTKSAASSADVLFTSTPTEALLLANMQSFPGTVQQIGPVTLSQVPGSIFLFWPFHNSRLRVHAMGPLSIA